MPLLVITIGIIIKIKDKEANLRSGPLSPARTDRWADGSGRGTVSGTPLATRSASELGPRWDRPLTGVVPGTGRQLTEPGPGGEGSKGERRGRRMGGMERAGRGYREGGRWRGAAAHGTLLPPGGAAPIRTRGAAQRRTRGELKAIPFPHPKQD